MSDKTALYWFTNDLRLKDNMALEHVARQSQRLAFLYVFNPAWIAPRNYQHRLVGEFSLQFIIESLVDLEQQLRAMGHRFHILIGNPVDIIPNIVQQNGIDIMGCNAHSGWYERKTHHSIQQKLTPNSLHTRWNNYLYSPEQLNSHQQSSTKKESLSILKSFSTFRQFVEQRDILPTPAQTEQPLNLPEPLDLKGLFKKVQDLSDFLKMNDNKLSRLENAQNLSFIPGELAAQCHLNDYFGTSSPSTYKQTRNALDGWDNSTKFSPYLAHGNLSPRQIWKAVNTYEAINIKNDDTYWIKFELLWREYFNWVALKIGSTLFRFRGMASSPPLTSFFAERFTKWCQGSTPYPLVNACMKQLNATGYMSNRGRQLTASCLINELGIDWRYGAAYFQERLIDHDVASNWGNWQYIAGVGTDPRGGRHFNLEKQTQMFDPHHEFIHKWQGDEHTAALDSLDASGWPIGMK